MKPILSYISLAILVLPIIALPADEFITAKISDSPSNVTMLSDSREVLTLNIKVGAVDFAPVHTKEGDFVLPVVKGFSRSHKIGEPSLPMVSRILSIPFDCRLQVELIESEHETISLTDLGINNPIIPVQPSLVKSDEPSEADFIYDHTIYQKDEYYRLPLVGQRILGTMRSLYLGMISFSPFEYNPVEKTLKVYKNITVRVSYPDADWSRTEAMTRQYYSPFFEPAYQRIINYDATASVQTDNLVKYPIKYVIIASRMFESQLQPFIEWKTRKGFNVIEAYTDVIGTSNIAIKNYIRSLYIAGTAENPAPSFVLLVGDHQQIPAFSGQTGSQKTDLYFCEFTGDYFPEIYYGRFSAQNTDDLQPQIDKTLEYEQYLMPDPDYLEKATLVAGVDSHNAYSFCNGQINYGTENYFNVAHGIAPNVWLYPESGDPGADAAIIQTINDGVGFYNYTAHCSHYGHTDPTFNTANVEDLTNIHRYLLGIGNCCQSNTFADDGTSPCFGEVFLRAENKGGVGYIGASEDTYWDEDYWWAVGYGPVIGSGPDFEATGPGAFDGIFHDHGEPVSQHYTVNGAIITAGNLAVTESGSVREDYYWEVYHLMGDPSVTTYFGIPSVNNVIFPSSIEMNAYTIEIEADPGSYVGITYDGALHGTGYVDASGMVSIPLTAFPEIGQADLMVTGQNKIPYSGTIEIVETSDPHILYDGHTINDAAGNNNGVVDAGESILLGIQLKNVGISDAYNVEATLSCEDSYITITDDFEAYGTIPGRDGVLNIPAAFAFSFSPDTPDWHVATFMLTVTGTWDSRGASRDAPPWPSQFTVTVHTPSVSFIVLDIDDSAENGNGLLEPGETGDLIVTIKNQGSGMVNNIYGQLSETDDCLSISDNSGFFGSIGYGEESDNQADPFTISVDAACSQGYQMTFDLNLTGDNGFFKALNFGFTVGGRVVIYADDFSVDKGWSGLGGSGEWTIGPATGGYGSDTYGLPDPEFDNSASEDNYLLGNDLNSGTSGDYSPNLSNTYWVISPVIDCSYFNGVQLSFCRRLGIEALGQDHAIFEVFDGTDWVRLFESESTIDETSWNEFSYDVAAYADMNPDFQIRFGIGPTNTYANYCGWNIDDIEIIGYDQHGTCGDVNDDEQVNILDIIFIIDYRYKSGPPPDPYDNGDVNSDGNVNILDIIYLINFLYKSGPALNCP